MRRGRFLLWQAAASSLLLAGAAAWPASIRVTGAAGTNAANINGYYAIENASQLNGKPVWVKQDARAWSLWFLAGRPSYWLINNAVCRDLCPETNITYKVAQYDDPTQELGVWTVPTGASTSEQDIFFEEGSWPQLVAIGGAAGANAGSINGNFSRSSTEVRNGKPVWISSDANATGGWGVWYSANAGMWLLSSSAERSIGGTGGYMYKPVSEADPVRELGPWTVNNGTAWGAQTLAVRDPALPAIAGPPSIRVTGALGPNAGSINGYYIVQATMRIGGRPVWVKADNATAGRGWSLWYFRRSGSWVISDASSRSAVNGGNDTNIIYKLARFASPTQEDASWKVRTGPGVVEVQSVTFEEATWPEKIRLDNATGPNGGYINGEFWKSPTEEANGRPVWVLQDPTNTFNNTLGMWYCMSSNQWIVSSMEIWRARLSQGWLWHAAVEADPVREQPPWQVWTGSVWQAQRVVAWDPALPAQAGKAPIWPMSIRVTGATGSNAANINGYYALDNTTEVNGRPLWLKADADSGLGWGLLWWRHSNSWLINNRSARLANSDRNLLFKEAQARMPTEQVSTWTVATDSGPQEQAVRFEAASWPEQLRITGATGTYAQSINGNYSRSPAEVRNGRPVWLLRTNSSDQSALGIWYSAASKQWLLSPGFARGGADPISILQKAVTEADPTRESGPWWVNCGPQLCALPLVVRDPALPDIPVQPAGQAASAAGRAQGGPALGATATALICVFSILGGMALICLPVWIVLRRKRAAQAAVTVTAAAAPASVPKEAQFIPEYWTNRDPGRHFEEWVEVDKATKAAIAALAGATWTAQWTGATWATEQTQDQCGGVPTGMEVVKAFRVENLTLWQRYCKARTHILEQRRGDCGGVEEIAGAAVRTEAQWDSRTLQGVSEVYLWVGATPSAATGICKDGFRLDLASNFPGAVYGTGVYLVECSSRSDQRAGDDHTGPYKGVFCMMLCRAVLGNAFRIEGGDDVQIDVESKMASKRYDSVVAGRQASGGTTAGREFIVYDPAQVYPEYVVLYLRKDNKAEAAEV